jgi:hypothetical protein
VPKDAELRFVTEYTKRLSDVANANEPEQRLKALHFWAARQRFEERDRAAQALNRCLGLRGEQELHGDLPCITAGSRKGLVIMSANPGWGKAASVELESSCAGKPHAYWRRTTNYFRETPIVFRNKRWWGRAIPYLELLPGSGYDGQHGDDAWEFAHCSGKFGSWELIPIPSSKDGATTKLCRCEALTELAKASVRAVLALRPRLLLVGHKYVSEFVPKLDSETWHKHSLPGNVSLKYRGSIDRGEIVLIPLQFLSAPRKFTLEDVVDALTCLRSGRSQGCRLCKPML